MGARRRALARLQRAARELGGDGGIRTLDRALQPYNGLANRRLQPLGHVSAKRAQEMRLQARYAQPFPPKQARRGRQNARPYAAATSESRSRKNPQRKLCGSTSIATLTPPRGCGAAATSARKKPCKSAERGARAANRKRWRLRRIAIGA